MPIRPENRARYPDNWPEISHRIRDRAGNKCEQCGLPNYAIGGRTQDGKFFPALPTGDNGLRLQWPTPGTESWCQSGARTEFLRIIRIVLTVAHLNHQPEDCRDENLQALCQRCHNLLDGAMRRAGIQARAREKAAIGDLLGVWHA